MTMQDYANLANEKFICYGYGPWHAGGCFHIKYIGTWDEDKDTYWAYGYCDYGTGERVLYIGIPGYFRGNIYDMRDKFLHLIWDDKGKEHAQKIIREYVPDFTFSEFDF